MLMNNACQLHTCLLEKRPRKKCPEKSYKGKWMLTKEMMERHFREISKCTQGKPATDMECYVPRQWESVPQKIWVSATNGEGETALPVTHYCNNAV